MALADSSVSTCIVTGEVTRLATMIGRKRCWSHVLPRHWYRAQAMSFCVRCPVGADIRLQSSFSIRGCRARSSVNVRCFVLFNCCLGGQHAFWEYLGALRFHTPGWLCDGWCPIRGRERGSAEARTGPGAHLFLSQHSDCRRRRPA